MKQNPRLLTSTLLLCFFLCGQELCYAASADTGGGEKKNNEQEYPARIRDRSTLEWLVAAPGLLINAPLKLLFKGIGATAGYIDESRLTDRVDNFFTSADGTKGVRPVYSSRGGAGFKFFHKHLLNADSKLEVSAAAGLRMRQKYNIALKRLSFSNGVFFAGFEACYRMQPDEPFFGLGPGTRVDDESSYSHEHASVLSELGVRLSGKLDLVASTGFDHNTILGGKDDDVPSVMENFDNLSLPGLEPEVRLVNAGLALVFDSRETRNWTVSGVEATVAGTFFDQPGGDDYAFWKLSADLKCYVHLFYGRALVLRTAAETTEPVRGGAVPFFNLSELGREETIRGFSRGRFRDLDKVLGSIEYHYPVWQHYEEKLAAFVFVDAGQVANDVSRDLDWDYVQVGFGGGFTFENEDGEILRILAGKSKDEYRLYAVLD